MVYISESNSFIIFGTVVSSSGAESC